MLHLFKFLTASLSLQEAGTHHEHGDKSSLSALDEDDSQMVIIENKLGCDIYVKKVEQNSSEVGLLRHNDCSSVWILPPRYSDRLNVADVSREPRHYVAVQIFEAKVVKVPIIEVLLLCNEYCCCFTCEKNADFIYMCRVYQLLMMETVTTSFVLCALSFIVSRQISKSFSLKVQGPNV